MREWSERHIRDVIRSELIKLMGGSTTAALKEERSMKNGNSEKHTPERDH